MIARFIQNVLRSTLLHANKTTKNCIQFLSADHMLLFVDDVVTS
jgi:hypothetical protein